MTYNKVFCKITRDIATGKKVVDMGKSWGNLPKRKANAVAILTGDGLMVVDIDTKDLKSIDKKLKKLLGEPTVETANGYHYYFTGDVAQIKQTQGLFDKVDIRNKGGLVFSEYFGKDKSIGYKWLGEPTEIGDKLKKYLIKASKERTKEQTVMVGKMVDVDGTWERALDGEHHSVTLALMIRDFKAGATYDEVWTKSMLYIDKYLGGNHGWEDKLFEARIADTYGMFANERFGFKKRSALIIGKPVRREKKKKEKPKDAEGNEKIFEIPNREDWMIELPVDTEAIIAYLHNTGYDHKRGKFRWVSSSGKSREFLRKDASLFFKDIQNDSTEAIDTYIDEWLEANSTKTVQKHKEYWNHIWNLMTGWVMFNHQFETIRAMIDPFGVNNVQFYENTMIVVTTDLIPKEVPFKEDVKIMKDYHKHFPQLNQVLDVMLSARFGADRKKAYFWMRADSDWGKSFLFSGVLASMGITTFMKEKELKLAMSGSPSGLNGDDFAKSWLTVFEEFKGAVSELKDITHTLTLAPKGGARVEVDLYSKIFLSAENVNSLVGAGGAEAQFANRFMMLNLSGSLVKRKSYAENQQRYLDVVRSYVYEYLMVGIKKYKKMGREGASVYANKVLSSFRGNHELDAEDLMDTVAERVVIYYQKVLQSFTKFTEEGTKFREEVKNIMAVKDRVLYITNLEKTKEHFVKSEFGASDISKLNHKTSKVLLGLEDAKRVNRNFGGINMNAYKVAVKK